MRRCNDTPRLFTLSASALEVDGRLDIIAPFGLDDLFAMVIKPNRLLDNAVSHTRKAMRALATWPELTVILWHADGINA
jgi:uncharacterized protein